MSGDWWVFIFLMVVMKAPIAYLAGVVWYACKAPDPPEPALNLAVEPESEPGPPQCPWRQPRRRPSGPRSPHGGRVTRATRTWHA